MKITVTNVHPDEMRHVADIIGDYHASGHADGSRPRQRNCVIYTRFPDPNRSAAVWGGPDHIRVVFGDAADEKDVDG